MASKNPELSVKSKPTQWYKKLWSKLRPEKTKPPLQVARSKEECQESSRNTEANKNVEINNFKTDEHVLFYWHSHYAAIHENLITSNQLMPLSNPDSIIQNAEQPEFNDGVADVLPFHETVGHGRNTPDGNVLVPSLVFSENTELNITGISGIAEQYHNSSTYDSMYADEFGFDSYCSDSSVCY